jgi:dephospho-CoA kinase
MDADRIYHDLIQPGSPLTKSIAARFPTSVTPDGAVDRRELGRIVFSDPAALADLDAIAHPAVAAETRARIAASTAQVVAIDAVKLVESGMHRECDQVWLVECSLARQLERLMARNGLSREEAQRRIDAQSPIEIKRAAAHVVVDNDGDLAATREQVEAAWAALPILQH